MGYLEETKSTASDCNTLISGAIDLYLQIERLYQSIEKDLSATSVLKIMQTMGTLNALLEKAREKDNHIAVFLRTKPNLRPSSIRLLEARKEIISRLERSNKHITGSAQNVKSLLRHEISMMSNSHNAMKSYKPAASSRKNIICDSF